MTSAEPELGKPESHGRLRVAARIAVRVGAVGVVGLLLWAGRRGGAPLRLMFFALWALCPFVTLFAAERLSKHWSVLTRATLDGVMLVLAAGTLAIYGTEVLGPGPPNALVFAFVPAASLWLIAIVVPIAALISARESRLARRMFSGVAIVAILGVLGVGALLGSLWLEHRTEITLPTPTGPFAVGRSIEVWGDDTPDPLAPLPGTKRELLVWIWFPAVAGPASAIDDYVPAAPQPKIERASVPLLVRVLQLLTRDQSKVHGHSLRHAAVAHRQGSYPVVIFRAGASAGVMNYSTLVEDLASHGYIVVGFDAPYRTGRVVFPDGRVVTRTQENNPEVWSGDEREGRADKLLAAWTADMAFVLDRLERLNTADAAGEFAGRIDVTRVGAIGHSFGGAAAARFCQEDFRCKAGIDIDGALHGSVIQTGLHQPFMFLLSDHGNASDPESRQIKANIQSIYDRLPAAGRLRVAIRGANHFMFGDDAILKSHLLLRTLRGLGILGIDGRRQLAVTTHCVHTFLDSHLKERGPSPVKISSPLFPELQILE